MIPDRITAGARQPQSRQELEVIAAEAGIDESNEI